MAIAERSDTIDTPDTLDTPHINRQGLALVDELQAIATRLCRATVQVRGQGPGGGSGVIWSSDGLIITNAHVARGARATVELFDGRTLDAAVTARDKGRDLAALTIDAHDLPAAAIGDSDRLRVGELVLAVGNPLGMVGALTTGIVHTIAPAEGPGGRSWVQADVRLAPGNSGGPLTNVRGEVVGINSMINGGLALAVPSNAVERFLRGQTGQAQRPYLGVTTQPVLVPLGGRRAFGLLVLEATEGGPAEAAGLITGDVLVGAGERRFREPDDLAAALYGAGVGATLSFTVVRGGRPITRDVAVRPAAGETAQTAAA